MMVLLVSMKILKKMPDFDGTCCHSEVLKMHQTCYKRMSAGVLRRYNVNWKQIRSLGPRVVLVFRNDIRAKLNRAVEKGIGWVGFYGISTFVHYLMPNPIYTYWTYKIYKQIVCLYHFKRATAYWFVHIKMVLSITILD